MKKNILIVDDSATVRKLVSLVLSFKGYVVTTANDGVEGWDELQKNEFSLAIIDLLMPNMDGFMLLTKMRSDSKLRSMPSIILTTEGDEENKKKALGLGAMSFMTKPFQPHQLLFKVAEFVK